MITITAATATTAMPSASPTCHRVADAITGATLDRAPKTSQGEFQGYDRPVAPDDVPLALARAAAEDGSCSRGSFDWLCEQGHVGLERVAKARRDPELAQTGRRATRRDLRPAERRSFCAARVAENLLLPVDLVHEATGT